MFSCCIGGRAERDEGIDQRIETPPPATASASPAIAPLAAVAIEDVMLQPTTLHVSQTAMQTSNVELRATNQAPHLPDQSSTSTPATYLPSSSSSEPPPPSQTSHAQGAKSSDRPTDSDAVSSAEGLDSVHSLGLHASSHQHRQYPASSHLLSNIRVPSPPPSSFALGYHSSPGVLSETSNALPSNATTTNDARAEDTSSSNNETVGSHQHKIFPKSLSAGRQAPHYPKVSLPSGTVSDGGPIGAGGGIASPTTSAKRKSDAASPPVSSSNSLERSNSLQSQGSRARSTLTLGPSILGRSNEGTEGPKGHRPMTHLGITNAQGGGANQVGVLRNTIIENLVKSGPVESSSPGSSASMRKDSGGLLRANSSSTRHSGTSIAPLMAKGTGSPAQSQHAHSSRSTTDKSKTSTHSAASSFILAN